MSDVGADTRTSQRRRRLRFWLAALTLGASVVILLAGLTEILVVRELGDLACEYGDSNYGTLSWSLVPPGSVCTWTVEKNGVDAVEGPGPWLTVWLIVSGASIVFTCWTARRWWIGRAKEWSDTDLPIVGLVDGGRGRDRGPDPASDGRPARDR